MIFKRDRAHETFIVNEGSLLQVVCPIKKINYHLYCCCHTMAHDMFVLSLRESFMAISKDGKKIGFGITSETNTEPESPSSTTSLQTRQPSTKKQKESDNTMYYITIDKDAAKTLIEHNLKSGETLEVKSFLMGNIDPPKKR